MTTDKKLQLVFSTDNGKTLTLYVDEPREPINPTDVKNAMDSVIANNLIISKNGPLTSIKGAYFVTRTVEEITLP